MGDLNPLNTNYYYAGVQNASSSVKKDEKAEKSSSAKKTGFREFLKKTIEPDEPEVNTIEEKIASMPIEEAVVFLKDRVDIAGDKLSESQSTENIAEFKNSVRDFIKFVVNNNYNVTTKRRKGLVASQGNYFSTYQLPLHQRNPRVQIQIIDKKIDELARYTIKTQHDKLVMLGKINEIKGLIVDFLSS